MKYLEENDIWGNTVHSYGKMLIGGQFTFNYERVQEILIGWANEGCGAKSQYNLETAVLLANEVLDEEI